MLKNIVLKSIRDYRWATLWWSIGVSLAAAVLVAIYPDYSKAGDDLNELLKNPAMKAFVGELVDLTTPEGFLTMEGYHMFFPVLIIIFSIMLGTAFIAGEEKDGTLELLTAISVSRHTVIVHKFLALLSLTMFLGFIFFSSISIGAIAINMDISLLNIANMSIHLALLGLIFGSLSFFIGSTTGTKSYCIGISATTASISYLVNAFSSTIVLFDTLKYLSPFYYYIDKNPLIHGFNLWHTTTLIFIVLILGLLSLFPFNRRSLT
mgnify:CR=1 FL=1|tara:strand:- start:33 stop:824 length:792 start_codon:yes stop_codon:yes gene_type:complete